MRCPTRNVNYLKRSFERGNRRWDSSVWIENEPNNIVHFEDIGKEM